VTQWVYVTYFKQNAVVKITVGADMANVKFNRCLQLPEVLQSDHVYFVQEPDSADVRIVVTGNSSDVVKSVITAREVSELIDSSVLSNGILKVDILPAPSEDYRGRLLCLTTNGNRPCWCDGSQWFDLLAAGDGGVGPGSSLDDSLVKKLRNSLYFGIKLI